MADEDPGLTFLAGSATRPPQTQEERWLQVAGQMLRQRADEEHEPEELPQPRRRLSFAIGAALGLVLGIAAVLVAEWMERR